METDKVSKSMAVACRPDGYSVLQPRLSVTHSEPHFRLRGFLAGDLPHLYRVCLLTGNDGEDGSEKYRDPEILGHLYAAPYAVLEPELTFILEAEGEPCGYILGTADSENFADRCEKEWFPRLRRKYPLPAPADESPDARIIRQIHEGLFVSPETAEYPAHLHIDLLPVAQGKGWGRIMMDAFLNALRNQGVTGVHLGVSAANPRAIAFYRKYGFSLIRAFEGWSLYGLRL